MYALISFWTIGAKQKQVKYYTNVLSELLLAHTHALDAVITQLLTMINKVLKPLEWSGDTERVNSKNAWLKYEMEWQHNNTYYKV
jgi:hypothetical protein